MRYLWLGWVSKDFFLGGVTIGLFFILTVLHPNHSYGQEKTYKVIDSWLKYTDASNSLYHYFSDQAHAQLKKREEGISQLHTLSEWQDRQAWVKKTLMQVVGPFPEKTPLNAKVIEKAEKEDFSIENIVFESQPGFYVTSSLFIPKERKKKLPAIVYCSGHTTESYKSATYQQVILNLVKKGFIVFAFDPIGQGERLGYYNVGREDPSRFGINKEGINHSYSGVQAFIKGSSQAKYMIWDGIRAIDYLVTRKEVDSNRLGITGRSGGGTQSAYIGAIDDRIWAAAPENYITNFKRLLQSKGPQDAEQNLYHQIVNGLDHPDFIEVRAPKPTLLITTSRDIFSPQGVRETAEEASKVYGAYGKPNNFRVVMDDSVHASTKKNRESMYAFFQKHLNNPGDSTDVDVQLIDAKELRATKTGQVVTSFSDAETVFSLNKKEAEKAISRLEQSRRNLSDFLPKALKSAKELSGYRVPSEYHSPVFTGRYQRKGYTVEKYFVKGEGNYVIPYLILKPDTPNGKALIALNPKGKSEEISRNEIKWFVEKGFTVMIPDLIGTGEMGPGKFYTISHRYFGLFSFSALIGRSMTGIRAGDVNRLTEILKKKHSINEVSGLARDEMTPVLLHAAVFNKDISRMMLINPLSSYQSLVFQQIYKPSFVYGAVPGALAAYDLPDLAANLAPRTLTMINSVNGRGETMNKMDLDKEYAIIKAAYNNLEQQQKLEIIDQVGSEDYSLIFSKWINNE